MATCATTNASPALTPCFRIGGRVRGRAVVADVGVRHRERPRLRDVDRSRMRHHRQVESCERATVEQLDLAAAALLGRGAVHLDRDAELVGQRHQRRADPDRDRRDEVVPARMSETGEGVVLGADADPRRAGSIARQERCVQAEVASL